jgi:FixJ family two-component response regulator
MSGYLDEASKARARAAGFTRHLEKPIDSQTLLEAIHQVFSQAQRRPDPAYRSRTRLPQVPDATLNPL